MLANLNRSVSQYQNLKYFTGALDREIILNNLSTLGYCWYRDTNLQNDLFSEPEFVDNDNIDRSQLIPIEHVQSCLFGDNYRNKLVGYNIGTDARDQQENSPLLSVSKISSNHWVPYHNELLYTNEFPRIIAFLCMKAAAIGGHTPFCNTVDVYQQLPDKMRNEFHKFGIQYVRNLRDKVAEHSVENNPLHLGGQKFMQDIFNTNDRTKIESLCELNGYEYKWNLCGVNKTPILRIKYVAPAIVEYEFGDKFVQSFANSVTGMNGRYFTNYDAYYDTLAYIDRPFHSLWGNGDEFSDDEYAIIENLFEANSIKFPWQDGDVFIADNLTWAHGRTPYEGDRRIFVMMGEPYQRHPFMITPKR